MKRLRLVLFTTAFVGCIAGTSDPTDSSEPSSSAPAEDEGTPSNASAASDSQGAPPMIVGDRRLFTGVHGRIFDPYQARKKDGGGIQGPVIDWNVATSRPVTASPAVAGTSFTAGSSSDVFVFAVNATGNNRGITNSTQLNAGWANAARNAGIFVLTDLYQLKPDLLTYALDNVTTASFATGGIVVNLSGTKAYALSAQGTLYCIAIPAGGPRTTAATRANNCSGWTNYVGSAVTYSAPWPVYDAAGNVTKLYFGDDAGVLHCVNASTGASCWAGGGGALAIPTTSPLAAPIAYNNVVYVGDNLGRFFRVNDTGVTPSSSGIGVASWDLCGSAPGTCASNPWGIRTSPTLDTQTNTVYVASGGRIFEFPVGVGQNWQPVNAAKVLVASPTTNILSNPVLDLDGKRWLYVGFNNSIYKVRYPFDGSTTNGVFSRTLQRTVAGDASYPRSTPLPFNGVVYVGSGNGTQALGEQYACTADADAVAPVLRSQTAVTYTNHIQSAMVVDYVTGNVNFGYGSGTSAGGAVQYKGSGSPDWACPSGQTSNATAACGTAGCWTGCTNAASCIGTNQATKTCTSGVCGGTCNAGFADCNNNKNTDGCETNTGTSTTNCGSCGNVCSTNHMTPTCTGGACGGTCAQGYANCNANIADGCEAAVSCGNCCGNPCGAGQACVQGTCVASTLSACVLVSEHQDAVISCPAGTKVTAVTFASYGTPTGSCGSFATSSCHATTSSSVVNTACIGKTSCTVSAENGIFGDPCEGTFKRLYVQVACGC